jgi:uncharacterized phage protein gp47/JayE
MPFPRPTLTALRTRAMQDITASDLPDADGFLRRAFLRVVAWVQAGLAHQHYGYLDWIARQATPFTATDEYLDVWAALAPTPVLRIAPQAAIGSAQFSGVATTPLPSGTLTQRSDGAQYQTTADATVIGSTVTAPIVAVLAGSAGNIDLGSALTLAGAIGGINSAGTASTALTGGTDLETDAALRARMLESYAAPPAGGAGADYVTWALEVPGVTRAWCRPVSMGAGTVTVYFMMDVAEAAHNGFPQGSDGVATAETRDTAATGDQLAVANYIFGPGRRPVTALVYAVAPAADPIAFTLAGLSTITTGQRAAVTAAIAAALVAKGDPLGTTGVNQSDIDAAIGAVPGLPAFAVTTPSSWPLTPAVGSLLTVDAVAFA